jgi:hypothetical protein
MTLPRYFYQNPELVVEQQEIRVKNCQVCERSEELWGVASCIVGKKFPSCKQDKKGGFQLIEAVAL